MRNKKAKELKREVMFKMYLDKETTKEELQKERKSVFASSDFKPVYRSRKKNYNSPQVGNEPPLVKRTDSRLDKILEVQKRRRAEIKNR